MSGNISLDTLRRRAIHIKREQSLSHHQALNQAAVERGFQNYAHAVRISKSADPVQERYEVILSQFWMNRGEKVRGNETLSVVLGVPLSRLIQTRHLVGYLSGIDFQEENRMSLPFRDHMDDSYEYAMERLHRVARTLKFIEATGLYPSTAVRCYPKGDWENRPPIADHDHCWYHRESKQYVLTTEPYPGARERRPEKLQEWKDRFDFELINVPTESVYGYGTELWMAARSGGVDLGELAKRLQNRPISKAAA